VYDANIHLRKELLHSGKLSIAPQLGISYMYIRESIFTTTAPVNRVQLISGNGSSVVLNNQSAGLNTALNISFALENDFAVGIRIGYCWSPFQTKWDLPRGKLTDGPSQNLNYIYVGSVISILRQRRS
jgi:hypothetical protein